jgi:hypothetical protein
LPWLTSSNRVGLGRHHTSSPSVCLPTYRVALVGARVTLRQVTASTTISPPGTGTWFEAEARGWLLNRLLTHREHEAPDLTASPAPIHPDVDGLSVLDLVDRAPVELHWSMGGCDPCELSPMERPSVSIGLPGGAASVFRSVMLRRVRN